MLFSRNTLIAAILETTPTVVNALTNETEDHHIHRHYKRGGETCAFPYYEGMVAVQESGLNAGWAMHFDQACDPGKWCPYACQPGQLMGQWDPSVTSYTYPGSQYGGLYCQEDGTLKTPFPEKPYCYEGKGTVYAQNRCGESGSVAFCQTVLPGNEEMLIPTLVTDTETLAVPGPEYWAGTAAHYYINPPGVTVDEGCKWGDSSHPWGNWCPYVAGANMDNNGNTFVKIGWNPVYLENSCPFKDETPEFGIKITCDDPDSCEGLPCSIDPSVVGVNGVSSDESSEGAGGGAFCVVTAKNCSKARIEVFAVGSGEKEAAASETIESTSSSAMTQVKRDEIYKGSNITTGGSSSSIGHEHQRATVTQTVFKTITVLS